jgi:dihydropteroate synthase
MGVLNITPDSFSDGGRFLAPDKAIAQALRLLDEGADILDLGGESTRPGVTVAGDAAGGEPAVSAQEEMDRILPVIEAVCRERPEAVLSVDTYKAEVARAAVRSGVEIVNDVSGLQWDPAMTAACARLGCGAVLMHTRGRPTEWQTVAMSCNIATDVEHDLANRVQAALESGIARESLVLDPGFGFGKNFEENYSLLAGFAQLQRLGFPLLAGVSRKSFVGAALSRRTARELPAGERLAGSLAAMAACILRGAAIVRVHDVKPSLEAAAVADEIVRAQL